MHDRKSLVQDHKSHAFKITEAKHIQSLSPVDQELFVQLFYHKIKKILLEPPAVPEPKSRMISYNSLGLFSYALFKVWNVLQPPSPFTKLDELSTCINDISNPTVYSLNPQELYLYQKIENLIIEISALDKNKQFISDKNMFAIHFIYEIFFKNTSNIEHPSSVKKTFEQLQELQDLYIFPSKYIDNLKKNHIPVYGYKIS